MLATRREFLKLCAALLASRFLPALGANAARLWPGCGPSQEWVFPLAFPAWFPTLPSVPTPPQPKPWAFPLSFPAWFLAAPVAKLNKIYIPLAIRNA